MYSYGSPHTAAQKQDDQHERTFSSYVRIRVVVLKTYLGRWTIGRSGERGSGISMLPARYDDDDCGTPSLSRSCAISAQYTKYLTVEKKRRYWWCLLRKKLMRTLSERRFYSFNMDDNSSAESVDKLRLRTRAFNSIWENGCGASSSRTTSSSSSCPSTLEASSSQMSGSSPKIGTGISS